MVLIPTARGDGYPWYNMTIWSPLRYPRDWSNIQVTSTIKQNESRLLKSFPNTTIVRYGKLVVNGWVFILITAHTVDKHLHSCITPTLFSEIYFVLILR